jgi:hypothetical protein
MKAYMWSENKSELILNSALDGGEWSASRPGRFNLSTYWKGKWVYSIACLEVLGEKNNSAPADIRIK